MAANYCWTLDCELWRSAAKSLLPPHGPFNNGGRDQPNRNWFTELFPKSLTHQKAT
ncbi:MAG: hypothetical protein WAJ88_00530 [Pseudolabrys sp.]